MSPYHFIRLYRAVFGETPKQCQLQARLEKAKHLLILTDFSITDVCMEAGFSSLGTFTLRLHTSRWCASNDLPAERALNNERPQRNSCPTRPRMLVADGQPLGKFRNF